MAKTRVSLTQLNDYPVVYISSVEELSLIAKLFAGFKPMNPVEIKLKKEMIESLEESISGVQLLKGIEDNPKQLQTVDSLIKITPIHLNQLLLSSVPQKIGGYDVENRNGRIEVGCWQLTYNQVTEFYKWAGLYGGKLPKDKNEIKLDTDHSARFEKGKIAFVECGLVQTCQPIDAILAVGKKLMTLGLIPESIPTTKKKKVSKRK